MKNQEITVGDSVTYVMENGCKITQPITKDGLLNQRGGKKSPGEINNMLETTAFDKRAKSYSVNAELVQASEEVIISEFTKKERYNAKKDYRDLKKDNPNGFSKSLQQFRNIVTDKLLHNKMRVRMNLKSVEFVNL